MSYKSKIPTVSIIIPTYNRAHLVDRAIQSVLDQTYQDFELIVVDDASTDNTEEVVKSFKDKRIRYICLQKNKGGAAARNTGIEASNGEYIAFQDSDDEWLPEKLEKQMKVFENASPEVGVVYTGFLRIKDGRESYIPYSWVTQKEGNIHKELLKGNFVTTQAAVVKKKCFEVAGMFEERLPCLQDWELWIRVSKYFHFKCIDEPLVTSYEVSDSISCNQRFLIIAQKLISEKHYKDFSDSKKLLAQLQYSIGSLLCQDGELKEGRSYFFDSLKTYPFNMKCLLAIFISLFGEDIYNRVTKLKHRFKFLDV